jgi:hypothetical protein
LPKCHQSEARLDKAPRRLDPSFCHGWGLLADFCRVEDVFEWIGVPIFLHQLQVGETFRFGDAFSATKAGSILFEQRGRRFKLTVDHGFLGCESQPVRVVK